MRYNDPGHAKSSSRTPRLSVIFWYVDIVLIRHGGLYTPPPTPPESGGLQKAKIAENDHVTHGPTFLAGVHGLRGLRWTQPRLNMEKLPAPLATIYIPA